MYISESTTNEIQKLVHEAFIMNAKLDRYKTCLSAELNYPNTSALVHKLAHKYAIDMGDGLGDLIEPYNIPIIYGNIPLQDSSYLSVKQLFNEMLEHVNKFQIMLNNSVKIVYENNDLHIYDGLMKILKKHSKYFEQVILWKDMVEVYSEDILLDANIKKYDILN